MTQLRLLIVDDHPLVERSFRLLLQQEAEFDVVGGACSGREAVEKAREFSPDIILMDWQLGDMDGAEATRLILAEQPQIKIVAVSGAMTLAAVNAGIAAGIKGFVLKTEAPAELVRCVHYVARSQAYFCPQVSDLLVRQLQSGSRTASLAAELTPREREVLKLTAEGLRVKEIALELDIGVRTVETHRSHLMRKLRCGSSSELTRFAIREGIVRV